MPNWVLLLVRLVLALAASALMTWIGWKLGQKPWALVALVFSTPIIGAAIARPLVELFHDGLGWLSAQPLDKWQGNYYEFGGVQVRVYEDGGALWFAAKDVVNAVGIHANADTFHEGKILSGANLRCLSIAEIETLLATHHSHESGRFILWAQREVITPWARKRSGALVPR
jgi:hypothetical protein